MLETHSLSDNLETGVTTRHSSQGGEPSTFLITDIRGAARSERLNIYVNDRFFCSLDIAQIVDLKIKIGRNLNTEELAELKKASDFGKFYCLALEYALLRPRSQKEMRDYLKKKTLDRHVRVKDRRTGQYESRLKEGYDASLIEPVMQRLTERSYLDDRRFAKLWIENRNVTKGTSLKKLKIELLQKGISDDIIEELLSQSDRNDADELRKIVQKKWRKYNSRQKFIAFLLRKGFNYSDIVDELSSEALSFEED